MPRPLPTSVSLGRVIATRSFSVRGKPRVVAELRIGEPRNLEDQDAYCPVQLVGIGDEKVRPIFGIDTVQALQLALRYLDPLLMQFGEQLQWGSAAAHKSLFTEPWKLFEDAGLSELLSELATRFAKRATKRTPTKRTPAVRTRRR